MNKVLTCDIDTTIYDASILMKESKLDYILITNNDELEGIVTTKDIGFSINLNNNNKLINDIMTKDPLCAIEGSKMEDIINVMINKKFRHLPIINKDSKIINLIDIRECYNYSINKLEKLYSNNKGIDEILEIGKIGNGKISQYLKNLKKLLQGPILNDVLHNGNNKVIYCNINDSVYKVGMKMKEFKRTAIIVKDDENDNENVGIFTTKDLVFRVISEKLDVHKIKIGDVMTKSFKFANKNMNIHDALEMMINGKYLNLPIVDIDNDNDNDDNDDKIIGIIDVIKLMRFTLNQIKTLEELGEDDEDENVDIDGDNEVHDYDEEYAGDISIDEIREFEITKNDNIKIEKNIYFKIDNNGKKFVIKMKISKGFPRLEKEILKIIGKKDVEIGYYESGDLIEINDDESLKNCVEIQDSKMINIAIIKSSGDNKSNNTDHNDSVNVGMGVGVGMGVLGIGMYLLRRR